MSKVFNTLEECSKNLLTKGELASYHYPDDEYSVDCAIPQPWLDDAYARGMELLCGESGIAPHFVTVYPKDGTLAFIGPITLVGVRIAAALATVK